MKVFVTHILWLTAIFAVGCNSGTGTDSLFATKGGGAVSSGCVTCHNATSTIAPDPLITNGTGTYGKHIAHVQNTGIPCEKCHYNYINAPTHMNGHLDTPDPAVLIVYFDATNPTGSWINDTGPSMGSCTSLNCHGPDTLDWYGTSTANFQNCGSCHSSAIGPRRRVTGAEGDFGGNASIVSHHVTTTGDPDREQCLVCHDQSSHTAGTVRLRNADTGSSIVYDPVNPVSLEPFCLSCHDADGAMVTFITGGTPTAPFNDGSALGSVPNEAGNKIASYWNAAYTVHRSNGLTCAGTGAPVTGCHGNTESINMHGSTSQGILSRNMIFPIPASAAYDYNQFKLCFDCHENYPSVTKEVVLGYKQGGNYDVSWAPSPYSTPTTSIRSLFRDRHILDATNYPLYWIGINQAYNDNFFGDTHTPLHNFHLSPTDGWMQNVWDYRRSGAIGRASCVTCHNVHGTNSAVRSTYEELGLSRGTGVGPDEFVAFGGIYGLVNGPINCTNECHSIYGVTTYYWHTPADE